MKIPVAALVIAVIALGFSVVAWGKAGDLEAEMRWTNADIVKEVEAIGGWGGEFIELERGEMVEGYTPFAWYRDKEDAERFVKSRANIKMYGIMAIQREDNGWQVYRKFPS